MKQIVSWAVAGLIILGASGCKQENQTRATVGFEDRVDWIRSAQNPETALHFFTHVIGSPEAKADPERFQKLARAEFDGDYQKVALLRLAGESVRCDPQFFREIVEQTPGGNERTSLIHRGLHGLPADEAMKFIGDLSTSAVDGDIGRLCQHFESIPNALVQLANSDLKLLVGEVEDPQVVALLENLLHRRLEARVGARRPKRAGTPPTIL